VTHYIGDSIVTSLPNVSFLIEDCRELSEAKPNDGFVGNDDVDDAKSHQKIIQM